MTGQRIGGVAGDNLTEGKKVSLDVDTFSSLTSSSQKGVVPSN